MQRFLTLTLILVAAVASVHGRPQVSRDGAHGHAPHGPPVQHHAPVQHHGGYGEYSSRPSKLEKIFEIPKGIAIGLRRIKGGLIALKGEKKLHEL